MPLSGIVEVVVGVVAVCCSSRLCRTRGSRSSSSSPPQWLSGAEAAPLYIIVAMATLTTGLADTYLYNEGGDVSSYGPAIHDGATKGIRWFASHLPCSPTLCAGSTLYTEAMLVSQTTQIPRQYTNSNGSPGPRRSITLSRHLRMQRGTEIQVK